MGGTKRTAELSLLAKVDQQTVERSIRHLRELRTANLSVVNAEQKQTDTLGEVNAATQRNINAVRQSIAAARQENLNRQQALRGLDQEAVARREVAQAADRQAASAAKAAKSGSRGQSAFESAGNVSTGLSSLGSFLPGGAGDLARTAGDISGFVEQIPRLTQGIRGLAGGATEAAPAIVGLGGGVASLAAAGAAGIALAALAIAVQAFIKDISEAQETLSQATNAQVRYYELIETGTADEIQIELRRTEIAKRAREAVLLSLEAEQARLGVLGEIAKVFGIGPAKEIERLNEEIEKLNYTIDPLQRALQSPEVTARTAAAAQKKLADEQEKAAKSTKDAALAQSKQAEAAKQVAQATNVIADLYASIVDKAKSAAAELAKTEAQRLKDIQALNQRYAQDSIDAARQQIRDEAREKRTAEKDAAIQAIRNAREIGKLQGSFDFAAIADLRSQQANDRQIQTIEDQYAAREKVISQQEQEQDKRIAYTRELASLNARVFDAQQTAAQNQLEVARQVVAEYFKAKNILGDVSHFSDALILRIYKNLQGAAGVPGAAPTGQGIHLNPQVAKRALGGPLTAGQWSMVNERPGQRESFNGTMLPSGAGLFYPLRSGSVSAGGGLTLQVNVSGNTVNDARVMSRIAGEKAEEAVYHALSQEIQ